MRDKQKMAALYKLYKKVPERSKELKKYKINWEILEKVYLKERHTCFKIKTLAIPKINRTFIIRRGGFYYTRTSINKKKIFLQINVRHP